MNELQVGAFISRTNDEGTVITRKVHAVETGFIGTTVVLSKNIEKGETLEDKKARADTLYDDNEDRAFVLYELIRSGYEVVDDPIAKLEQEAVQEVQEAASNLTAEKAEALSILRAILEK